MNRRYFKLEWWEETADAVSSQNKLLIDEIFLESLSVHFLIMSKDLDFC